MSNRTVTLLVLFAAGCGSPAAPTGPVSVPPAASAGGQYPLRTDFLVVGKTGLDGAPKRWYTPGYLPLRSLRLGANTPDRDIADDLRKQVGKNLIDPSADLTPAQSVQLTGFLTRGFGTPAQPRVSVPPPEKVVPPKKYQELLQKLAATGVGWNAERIGAALAAGPVLRDWLRATAARDELKLDDAALARGSVVYRRWCMQCHGPSGAGDGAHAIELSAPPRDYRQGIFKFVTALPRGDVPKKGLGPKGKPLRDDLRRTVRTGIDGSMMPAFPTLSEQELDDLVGYVVHLAVRGETEFATMAQVLNAESDDYGAEGPALEALFDQNLAFVLLNWGIAAESPIPQDLLKMDERLTREGKFTAEDRLASAFRGYKLYGPSEFACGKCHGDFGRTPSLMWDLWGTVVQPRNLTLGVYRGGRRGEDLYARIYGGIHPSTMPGFQDKLAGAPFCPDRPDRIWNVVHFLQALSDPADRKRLQDPAVLIRVKERLKAADDPYLEDLTVVTIDP